MRTSEVHDDGVFRCAGCGAELFASEHKFESGTGWPSFDRAVTDGRVLERKDRLFGAASRRTEILCASCGGLLGHVFPDGPTGDGPAVLPSAPCRSSSSRRVPSAKPTEDPTVSAGTPEA